MSVYGTSVVRRLSKTQAHELDAALLSIAAAERPGRPTYVYLLTDFDASGMGIAETVEERLAQMAHPTDVIVERIAATSKQIAEYGLITQPVTRTDSRARKFIERFGTETVELDAIPASEVRRLVGEAIERHMDPRRLAFLRMVEQEERDGIRALLGAAS
jgi:hypothetical protein